MHLTKAIFRHHIGFVIGMQQNQAASNIFNQRIEGCIETKN